MYFIFWYDYLLLPVYLIIMVVALNGYFRRRHGYNPSLKKHFNRALALKIIACISIGMIYEYYYAGAYDGRFYFDCAKLLTSYWLDYPYDFFKVLFSSVDTFNVSNQKGLNLGNIGIWANESFTIGKIAAVFNIVSFNAFLPCSLFFCTFSFLAIWNLFIFFTREFKLSSSLAGYATLYIPSVLIWSSGIFKDTVTFTALCWMFICGFYAFVKPRKLFWNISFFFLCTWLIAIIKIYIIAAFLPFFILYIFNSYKTKIQNTAIKTLATPFILALAGSGIFLFFSNAEEMLGIYSLDNVLETASITSYHISQLQAGSAYSINVDFNSTLGLLQAIPAGINVTLFRPYPWEYLKPFTLLASAESMILLYFTIKVIGGYGFGKTFKLVWRTPILQLCLLFTIVFAFMVGISAANFGTLVRYKIPCLPFYYLFLALIYKANVEKNIVSKRQIKVQEQLG